MKTEIKNAADVAAAKTGDLVAFYNVHNADKPIKKFVDRATAEARCVALVERLAAEAAPKRRATDKKEEEPVVVDRRGSAEETDPARGNAVAVAAAKFATLLRSGHCPHCGAAEDKQRPAGRAGEPLASSHKFCEECKVAYHWVTGKAYVAPEGSPALAEGDTAGNGGQEATEAAKSKAEPKPKAKKASKTGTSRGWGDPEVAEARKTRHGVKVGGVQHKSLEVAFRALGLTMTGFGKFRKELKAAGKGTHGGHHFTLVEITKE